MTAAEVETYLHEHIPLSAAMGVQVERSTPAAVVLRAPLAPNINHRATAFGGSVSALAILAAWSWLNLRLHDAGRAARLVIQQNQIDYRLPVLGELRAECAGVSADALDRFLRTLQRHGRARLELTATVGAVDRIEATFRGEFVALPPA